RRDVRVVAMKRLLVAVLLASGCGSGLLDHSGIQFPGEGTGQCQIHDSPSSCGPTCAVCQSTARGTAVCVDQQCGVRCDPGTVRCDDGCCTSSALAAGGSTTCVVAEGSVAGGSVHCWGANDSGQLGADAPRQSAAPAAIAGTQ